MPIWQRRCWAACRFSVPALNFSAAASRRVGRSSFRTSLGCLASQFFFHVSLAFWHKSSLSLHKVPIEDPTTAEPGIALGPKAALVLLSRHYSNRIRGNFDVCTKPTKVEVPRWMSGAACNSVHSFGMHLSVCQSVRLSGNVSLPDALRILRVRLPRCTPHAVHVRYFF